ncbi:uncharacterized protein A1O5_13461, partial [Cladophialophora psammophila CBS 110553]
MAGDAPAPAAKVSDVFNTYQPTRLFKAPAGANYTSIDFNDSGEFLLLSRTDDTIQLFNTKAGLQKAQSKVQVSLQFNSASVSAAVHFYIEHSVQELSRAKQYKEVERRDVMKHLISPAADTFLWVAIVCLRLRQEPRRRLRAILKESPDGLDALYDQMLQQVGASRDCDLLKQILAVVKTAYRPITIRELSRLNAEIAEMIDEVDAVKVLVGSCGSFLTIPMTRSILYTNLPKTSCPRRLPFHSLLTKLTTPITSFFPDHSKAMSVGLRGDIYSLSNLGCHVYLMQPPTLNELAPLQYAC